MGFAPTWLRQVSPLLHMTTLTTDPIPVHGSKAVFFGDISEAATPLTLTGARFVGLTFGFSLTELSFS